MKKTTQTINQTQRRKIPITTKGTTTTSFSRLLKDLIAETDNDQRHLLLENWLLEPANIKKAVLELLSTDPEWRAPKGSETNTIQRFLYEYIWETYIEGYTDEEER